MVLIRSDLPAEEKEIHLSHYEGQLAEREQVLIDREQQLVAGKLQLLGREERVREAQNDVKQREKAVAEREKAVAEREKAVAEREAAQEARTGAPKEKLILPTVKSRKRDVKGGDGESKASPSQRAPLAKALTRPPSKMASQSSPHCPSSSSKSCSDGGGSGEPKKGKGKKKASASGGAGKIRKRPRNAFNFYVEEMRERLTEEAKAEQVTENRTKNVNAQLGRLAGAEWRDLPDENKSRYKAMAEEERKAFDAQEQIDIEQ